MSTPCRRISTPYRLVVSEYKVPKFLFVCESHSFFGVTLYYSRLIIDKTKVLCGLIVPGSRFASKGGLSWVIYFEGNHNLTMTATK